MYEKEGRDGGYEKKRDKTRARRNATEKGEEEVRKRKEQGRTVLKKV